MAMLNNQMVSKPATQSAVAMYDPNGFCISSCHRISCVAFALELQILPQHG
jgi:hypothetical protein